MNGGYIVMPFEYSCFISYRHCRNQLGKRIVNELYDALSGELELMTDKEVYPILSRCAKRK